MDHSSPETSNGRPVRASLVPYAAQCLIQVLITNSHGHFSEDFRTPHAMIVVQSHSVVPRNHTRTAGSKMSRVLSPAGQNSVGKPSELVVSFAGWASSTHALTCLRISRWSCLPRLSAAGQGESRREQSHDSDVRP